MGKILPILYSIDISHIEFISRQSPKPVDNNNYPIAYTSRLYKTAAVHNIILLLGIEFTFFFLFLGQLHAAVLGLIPFAKACRCGILSGRRRDAFYYALYHAQRRCSRFITRVNGVYKTGACIYRVAIDLREGDVYYYAIVV